MDTKWKILRNFLGGTFHQGVNSPEEALLEYIRSVGHDWIRTLISNIISFLESELSVEEKNNFIRDNAEIYFPVMKINPTEWLKHVVVELKRSLNEVKE